MSEDIIIRTEEENFKMNRVVYYILGFLEILLAFRLIFKLLGANPGSGFVSFIYLITQVFLAPFNAIFSAASTQGIETKAFLEPSAIIAMIVYALIAWGIVKLIMIAKGQKEARV
ncbi:MAG: YggT family protein [Syntrophomonadaceae bacterium]|nr:YggT family protein [Syntrophomonadaceae bacterium]